MKKIIALLLAAVMLMSMAACTPTPQPTEPPATDPAQTQGTDPADTVPAEFSYPVSGNPTLTMFNNLNANVKKSYTSVGESPVAQALMAATGITIEYQDTYADYKTAWNQMLADGTYTDMISFNPVTYAGGPNAAMEDGLAIPLNDIIDQYMPNLRAYLDANPTVDKAIKTDEGIYYMVPYVNSNTGAYSFGAFYREDLLKQLGATEPTTVDEWHDLLVRVKDELGIIPLSAEWIFLLEYGPFAMAFGVGGNSTSNHFAVDSEGKVYYQRNTPEYKEFLETMAQWYEEGLIDPDVASIASKDVNAKVVNGDVFMSIGWLTGAMQANQQNGVLNNPDFQLKAIGTPALNEGDTIEWGYATTLVSGVGTTISAECENVEMAARYLDFLFSEEGHIISNFGIEGESYTIIDGQPVFKDEIVKTGMLPEGLSQNQSAARYSLATSGNLAMYKHEGYYPQLMAEKCCEEAIYIWRDCAVGGGHMHELPNLSYTDDESAAIGKIITNLKTLTQENALKFVVGTRSFDEWDAFMAEIDNMGVSAALIIMNDAMARYNAR